MVWYFGIGYTIELNNYYTHFKGERYDQVLISRYERFYFKITIQYISQYSYFVLFYLIPVIKNKKK